MNKTIHLISVLTTQAGLCLTAKNWQEAGVDWASCYLESLLVKPGLALLMQLPNLSAYFGLQCDLVLNASNLRLDSTGKYILRSPYDGSVLSFSVDDIINLVLHLKPQIVIVPPGFHQVGDELWHELVSMSEVYISVNFVANYPKHRVQGLYVTFEQTGQDVLAELRQYSDQFPGVQFYVAGVVDSALITHLSALGVTHVESESPSALAYHGQVYHCEGGLNLNDTTCSQQFEVIDANCKCPTCEQQFTRAYLHYLLQHTPLLCQRLLIQHNEYYIRHRNWKAAV